MGPSSTGPASSCFWPLLSPSKDSAPGKGCPSPLSKTMKTMVLPTERCIYRLNLGPPSQAMRGSGVWEGPTAWGAGGGGRTGGELHRVDPWDRLPLPWPCPALFQGQIACSYGPCNMRASSTAPGYELIGSRQGSQSTRIEGRERGCYFNPKPPWEGGKIVKIIFAKISLLLCLILCLLSVGVSGFGQELNLYKP